MKFQEISAGLGTLLFLILLPLKLCHIISWSWSSVMMPVWLIPALFLLIAGIIYFFWYILKILAFIADFFA